MRMEFKDIRDDFTSDVYNTLDFLPTNNEANRIIDSFDSVVDGVIVIPKGATNGDMIKAMFGIADNDIDEGLSTTYVYTKTRVLKGGLQDYLREQITFNRDWWNAPYKRGNEND